jgi:hypothetical protein
MVGICAWNSAPLKCRFGSSRGIGYVAFNYCLAMLLLLVVTSFAERSTAQTKDGSIKGVILGQDSLPLPNAIVYALSKADMTHQIRVAADSEGRFAINHVGPGQYFVDAFKESDGYPYNFFSFFLATGPITVDVKAAENDAPVVIRLGPKAAHLSLRVFDEHGKRLSEGVTLIFSRPDLPGDYKRGVESNTELLVPPVPFRLAVEAMGYETWNNDGFLTPKTDSSFEVDVQLKLKQ